MKTLFVICILGLISPDESWAHRKKIKGDRQVKIVRKLQHLIKHVKHVDESGIYIKGPIKLVPLQSSDQNKLLFEIDSKNRKDIERVNFAIKKKNTRFSPLLLLGKANLQKEGNGYTISISTSGVAQGDYILMLGITLKKAWRLKDKFAFALVNFNKTLSACYDDDCEPHAENPGDGDTGSTGGSTGGSPSNPPTTPDEGLPIPGSDADSDGVRDDVEAYINSLNRTSLEREALISYAKKLQERILVVQDKAAANEISKKIQNYNYCLKSRFTDEDRQKLTSEIQIEQYNTKERLLAWAQTEGYLGGAKVELNMNESQWASYCEE